MRIDKENPLSFHEQIIFGIKEDILMGILLPGEKIPSVREMASNLLMNPNTVSKAYKQLEIEDILVTLKGKGTYINENYLPTIQEDQETELKDSLKRVVTQAKILGVSKERFVLWIENLYVRTEKSDEDTELNKND